MGGGALRFYAYVEFCFITKLLVASVTLPIERCLCVHAHTLKNSQNNSNDGKQFQVSAFPVFLRRLLNREQSFLEHLLCFSHRIWLLFLNCNRNIFCVEGTTRLCKLAFMICTNCQKVLVF